MLNLFRRAYDYIADLQTTDCSGLLLEFNSILRYECDKVLFRRMQSLLPERSEGDNSIRHDETFMHECRMRFYNTMRLERAFELECVNTSAINARLSHGVS